MVVRILLLLLLIVVPSQALRPTIKITVRGPSAAVQAAKDWLDSRLEQYSGRVSLASSGNVVPREDGESWEYTAFVQLASLADVRGVKQALWDRRSTILKYLHGQVVVHLCPAEGEVGDWKGCDRDERAHYEEITF